MSNIKRYIMTNGYWVLMNQWYTSTYIWDKMDEKFIFEDSFIVIVPLLKQKPHVSDSNISFIPDPYHDQMVTRLNYLNSNHDQYESMLGKYCNVYQPQEDWQINYYNYNTK